MKITANDYEANEIIKIMREWTELTQEQFGNSIHRSRSTIQSMETKRMNIYLHTFLEIAEQHGITITIEKKDKKSK